MDENRIEATALLDYLGAVRKAMESPDSVTGKAEFLPPREDLHKPFKKEDIGSEERSDNADTAFDDDLELD